MASRMKPSPKRAILKYPVGSRWRTIDDEYTAAKYRKKLVTVEEHDVDDEGGVARVGVRIHHPDGGSSFQWWAVETCDAFLEPE